MLFDAERLLSLLVMRVGNWSHIQSRDSCEVGGIARVQRDGMRDCTRRDERIVGSCGWLASRCAQCRCDATESPCAISVKRQDVKVRLCLLKVLLPGGALHIIARDVWTYG